MIEAFERVRAEVRRVVVGQDTHRRPCAGRGRHRRARAARGAARRGQDAGGQRAFAGARAGLPARPVHARHAALRRHGDDDAARRRARVPPRAGVHERPAGRRDQPHSAEDPGGAARGDAGAPGHGRRRVTPVAGAVPGRGHAEPDRVRGHLSAAGGAARPLPLPHRRRLSRRGGRASDPAARPSRRARALARPDRARRRRRRPVGGRRADRRDDGLGRGGGLPRVARAGVRASCPPWSSAPARARPFTCSPRRVPRPVSPGASS